MAAAAGDGNKPQQVSGEEVPEGQLPPSAGGSGFEQPSTPDRPGERTPERPPARRGRSNRRRHPGSIVALMSLRVLWLCRSMVDRLLQWFAARPLGQRALEAVGHTIATMEKATLWAGSATGEAADHRQLPLQWYLMMPIVMVLMVIRTGAVLAERYLDIQLPQNRELVNWLERQRIQLEQFQAVAAVNIRTVCVDENDPTHSFLNTWPFNIPYRAAQQLGIIPVRVNEQPSDSSTESSSVPSLVPVKSSSGSSTVTEAEKHPAHNSRGLAPLPDFGGKSLHFSSEGQKQTKQSDTEEEQQDDKREELTPPPEPAGDKSLYFSPDGERQKEESETEEQQDDKQEAVEGEKVKEQKTEQSPTISEEEAIRAAMAVVSPEPSAPPEQLVLEEAERAVIGVLPPPSPQPSPTSENLLGSARTEPGTSSPAQKAASKGSNTKFFVNLFGAKSFQNAS